MRRVKIKPLHCILSLIAVVILFGGTLIFSACSATAVASSGGDYRFHFTEYDLTYDVSTNRTMQVTEQISVKFEGKDSTGFIADIPVNAGEQVKNVNVTELIGNVEEPVEFYVVIEDNNYISVDIGDSSKKRNELHTYILTYTYCMTRAQEGKNFLEINAVTPDHNFEIENVNVTINLPKGCIYAEYYMGKGGSSNATEYDSTSLSTISLNGISLNSYNGLTFMMEFEDGILSTYFDFTPYWFVIAAAVVLLILILLRLLVFNKNEITPIVNFEAPDGMDPLMMGKLIDNTVNAEDVTALIFYWADKGYLKINLANEDNPILIRIKNLPETATPHELLVFNGLFRRGDSVATSALKYTFYQTYENTKSMVNSATKGLHKNWSIGISILFVLLSGFIIGLAPLIMAKTAVSATLSYPYGFIALIPALILYGFSESIKYNRLKRTHKRNALYFGGLGLGILACIGVFAIVIPSSLVALAPKLLMCMFSFTTATTAVTLIMRTHKYTEQLNHIVGFRNFIKFAEKERLEALLESDPQYYYHVLPYAQVLNVTDAWMKKFQDLTVEPPRWAAASHNVFDFITINHAINLSMRSISTRMIARPSSSGHSGGHGGFGGGRGGGHVGGGHGGSSFRGR